MSDKFNITPKREKELVERLTRQDTVYNIALTWGVTPNFLSAKLKKMGYKAEELKASGVTKLKQDMFSKIYEIGEPDKQFSAGMNFLKHYDKSDDVASTKTSVDANVTIEKCYLPLKDESN